MTGYEVPSARRPVDGAIRVPPSKSLHQRALLLRHLAAEPTRIEAEGAGGGEDVGRLETALETLGVWEDGSLGRSRERRRLDLGEGATGLRFALAAATLRPSGARTLVGGRPPLLARPHAPLRRALVRLGARIKRRHSGALRVHGGGLQGGQVSLRADLSSQFASALMLVAPRIGGLEIRFEGRLVSRPYLALTRDVLGAFGIPSEVEGWDGPRGRVHVPAGEPRAASYRVEPDASSAAPWWAAAAVTAGNVHIPGLPVETAQADAALLDVLVRMGAKVERTDHGAARVHGPDGDLRAAGDVDLQHSPDLLPLVAVLGTLATGRTRIVGVAHARLKESDRVHTVARGLCLLGADVVEADDGLVIEGRGRDDTRLRGTLVSAAGDHRLVFAFAVLGLVVPGVRVGGAGAAGKSYPGFLAELASATGEPPAGSARHDG